MPESDFEVNLRQLRREKLTQIVALGQQAYPNSYACTHTVPAVRAFDTEENTTETLAEKRIPVSLAGRLMAIRIQGKAGFAQLQQGGERLQIYVRKDTVGEDQFALYKLLDLGDHIGVRGHLFRTRTGELTVHVEPVEPVEGAPPTSGPALTFLTKAMLALPDKYHGLEDTELRYRQRYVDLFMNTGQTPAATQPPPPTDPGAPPSIPKPVSSSAKVGSTEPPQTPVILSEVEGPAVPPATSQPGAPPSIPKPVSSSAKVGSTEPPQTPVILSAVEGPAVPPATKPEEAPLNVRETFVKRAAILRAIRKFFDDRGYLEVETPMLHTVAGGAAARPFTTHHNALDIPLSLRIAPELFLKRLVVGGLDRVYEINRNFRNEGVSTKHNPEFTMLEFYQAYSNYEDLMQLTADLILQVAIDVNGTGLVMFNGIELNLGQWDKFSMREAIIEFWYEGMPQNPQVEDFKDSTHFQRFLTANAPAGKVSPESDDKVQNRAFFLGAWCESALARLIKGELYGRLIAELFEVLAEPHLIQPTIIYDFPLAVSPLSKQKPDDPDWVERFEFYIGGFEVGNAFSELNDPDEQRARFEAQLAERNRGDDEAHAMDEDYVRALSYGLPPTAGEGIGIDRLTMILTGAKSIRDVILFPLMRPLAKQEPTP